MSSVEVKSDTNGEIVGQLANESRIYSKDNRGWIQVDESRTRGVVEIPLRLRPGGFPFLSGIRYPYYQGFYSLRRHCRDVFNLLASYGKAGNLTKVKKTNAKLMFMTIFNNREPFKWMPKHEKQFKHES